MSKKQKAKNERLFYSFDGSDIRVPLPDGSVVIVGERPRPLPKKFWRAAIRNGCQTSDSIPKVDLEPELGAKDDPFTRMEAIKAAIVEALESDETDEQYADAFTANDIPNVRWLEKKVGFGLTADERDAAWREVQDNLPDDEPEGGEGEDEDEG